jgi:hypothetical protein
MNKLLIIPALLALTLFSVYHYKIEGKKLYEQPTTIEKMEQTILTKHAEMYTSKKERQEDNSTEEKVFRVEIPTEVNTNRDHETKLIVNVENANNRDACNFFWYEDEELIGMGETLNHSYSKGEHTITVIAKDGEGHEANATTKVTAWEYKKIETLHFNANYGDLTYREVEIYDHKGRYILIDDGSFAKRINLYDEYDNRIEHKVIYYDYPNESRYWLYTFDEAHHQLSSKSVNVKTGETLYYNVRTYDEEGNITSSRSGENEDNLYDDYREYDDPYGDSYYEYNSTYKAHEEDKSILNEAGLVTYEERNYDYMKVIEEYSYDSNNTMTQHISTMITEEVNYDITVYNYNDNQEVSSSEQIYKTGEEITCHYKNSSTYNEDGSQNTEKQEILDGICPEYVDDNSFKKYSYDEDGRVKNVTSSLEKESDDSQTTLKVIKSYTNELEG